MPCIRMNGAIMCMGRAYTYKGYTFEFAFHGLERLNKDGGVSKIRGDKFYSIVEEFQKLSDEDKAKYQLN